MPQAPRFSLLTQTGIIIGVISLLAVIGIGSSAFITQTIQGAGTTINTSGTLRMLSYKIATQMVRDQRTDSPNSAPMQALVEQFEKQLNHPSLRHTIAQPTDPQNHPNALSLLYQSIQKRWEFEIRPLLLQYAALIERNRHQPQPESTRAKIFSSYQQSYLSKIDGFVFDINKMVHLIEKQTESRIQLLRDIEYVSFPLLLLSILAAPILLYRRVLVPLKDLLQISKRVRQRDFSQQAHHVRDDELGELARAFNLMNSDLSATYAELEGRIMEKTQALIKESNQITLMEERNAIAQELHDSLAQSLFYIKIQISRIRTLTDRKASVEQLLPVVEEFEEINDAADRQLRELISTFRIQVNPEGMTAAIEKILKKQQEQHPTQLRFENRIPDCSFTHNEEIHLIQIIQEAVSNITKHAQASLGTIILELDPASDRITLTIEDDGIGIPRNPHRPNHFGLSNMSQRAENLHGTLSILPADHQGTQIRLSFPPTLSQENPL